MKAMLYSYWRSTAAYRVRIALNLKGIDYAVNSVNLKPGVDAQQQDDYRARNPQGLVPFYEDGTVSIAQSMAILDYLEESWPLPALLPADPQTRGNVRAIAQLIACDIHPLNNIGVLGYLETALGAGVDARNDWYAHWVHRGFAAIETSIERHGGTCAFGDSPTLADVCLVPQVFNARRFKVPLDAYPRIVAVEQHCLTLDGFAQARPELQPDAETPTA